MSDRIPCINPLCRRTADKEKMHGSSEMVCAKCWKTLPIGLRRRDRQLRRRWRLVERLKAKGVQYRRKGRKFGNPNVGAPQYFTMSIKMDKLWVRNWSRIRDFFQAKPEIPAGLEGFLREIGFLEQNDEKGGENG